MKKIFALLSRFSRGSRKFAAIQLYFAGIAVQWLMLEWPPVPPSDIRTVYAFLLAALFATLLLPLVISILNDDQKKAGIGPLPTY